MLLILPALAAIIALTAAPARAITLGVIGDSYSAEYANVGKRDDHRNYVEQFEMAGVLDFGTKSGNDYSFNFGVSGATTDSAAPQSTQLNNVLNNGNVDGGIIYLGINNFAGWNGSNAPQTYLDIYNNVPGAANATINNIVTDLTGYIDSLYTINPSAPIVIVNVPDWIATPGFRSQSNANGFDFTGIDPNNTTAVQRVTDAVLDTNTQIQNYANSLGLPVVDAFSLLNFGNMGSMSFTNNAADQINFSNPGINGQGGPMHFFADALHPGTLFHGLLANSITAALNKVYDAGLEYLTPQDIVDTYNGVSPTLAGSNFNGLFSDFNSFVLIPDLLAGDANNDGVVDLNDLLAVETYFGTSGLSNGYLPGDANDDGLVDGLDFIFVEQHFGESLDSFTPEPASLLLLAGGSLAMSLRRRR